MSMTVISRLSPLASVAALKTESRSSLWLLKALYVILHQVDLFLTVYAVNIGYHELNPFIRGMLDEPLQLALIKVVIPVMLAVFIPSKLLIPAVVAIALVVGWNIGELLTLF